MQDSFEVIWLAIHELDVAVMPSMAVRDRVSVGVFVWVAVGV